MNETYMTVVGRVISEVNQRTVASGDRRCSFRMVATERRFDREKNDWVDGHSLYVQVTCWRKLAENVGASLFKGDPVIVNGRVYVREYEVDGAQQKILELEARAVGPNLLMCTAMVQRPNWAGAPAVAEDDAVAAAA